MQDWPTPTNKKEIQTFLGLASYYQRFTPKFAPIAWCLHELVGPTSTKTKNIGGQKKGEPAAKENPTETKVFNWMPEHQQRFDALKEALVTAPVLGYPDFNREFVLEMDASLQGLVAVLSQKDETGKQCVIAYASQSLHPSKRSMCNYSSAKLELLALKWAVTEKFLDYLLGSTFMYTQTMVLWLTSESKLGASQIQWLSELALFDFTIYYWTGRSNKATNALGIHPHNDEDSKIESGSDCDELEVISYSSVCEVVDIYLNTTKVLDDLKKEALSISCMIQLIMEEEDAEEIQSILNSVSVFNLVTPEDMVEEQKKDPLLGLVCPYITAWEKLKSSAITKIKSKAVWKYLLQFHRLTFKQGVLHCLYINNDVEYHQMILPIKYQAQVLQMLHDGQGHQGMEKPTALCRKHFYLSTMYKDVADYVRNCPWCQVVKGPYVKS